MILSDGTIRELIAAGTLVIGDVPLAARQFLGMITELVFWPGFLLTDLVISDADVEHVIAEAVTTMLTRYGVAASRALPAGFY